MSMINLLPFSIIHNRKLCSVNRCIVYSIHVVYKLLVEMSPVIIFSLSRSRIHIKMIMMPAVRVFIIILLLLCTISFGSSQDCPPLTEGNAEKLLRHILKGANPSFNNFTPVCLSVSSSINRYRHAAVAVSYNITSPSVFSYLTGLLSTSCSKGNWFPKSFFGALINNTEVFNLPLLQNCSSCNVTLGPTLQCVRKLLLQ